MRDIVLQHKGGTNLEMPCPTRTGNDVHRTAHVNDQLRSAFGAAFGGYMYTPVMARLGRHEEAPFGQRVEWYLAQATDLADQSAVSGPLSVERDLSGFKRRRTQRLEGHVGWRMGVSSYCCSGSRCSVRCRIGGSLRTTLRIKQAHSCTRASSWISSPRFRLG